MAWLDGARVIAFAHECVGRGHAERLVPMLAALHATAGTGRAGHLLVDVGPGSFTGARIGVAAARALGLAWDAPVAGIESDRLVALAALARRPDWQCVLVSLDAGRGRLLTRRWTRDGPGAPAMAVVDPSAARGLAAGVDGITGAGLALIDAPGVDRLALDPDARAAALLPAGWPGLAPSPLYAGGAFGDAGGP